MNRTEKLGLLVLVIAIIGMITPPTQSVGIFSGLVISLGIMYVIVFKTSLVATSNGLMAGLSVIILLILKQLYGWVKSQNGN